MEQAKKSKKIQKNFDVSHAHDACARKYVYILSIKRSIYKSLEIIGVYSNISKAKKIVQDNFNNYKKKLKAEKTAESDKILSHISQWKYSNERWEHSKQDKRFYFYALSQDLNSYYQIVKLELDAEEVKSASDRCNNLSHVRKKRKENLTDGNNQKEDQAEKDSAAQKSFVS